MAGGARFSRPLTGISVDISMQTIPLTLAQPGMVLAKEVTRPEKPDGPALFGKGTELSESAIDRLKQLGVATITVEGHPVVMEDDESLDQQLAGLDQRFRHVERDPYMMKIKALIRKQIVRSMEG